MNKKQQDYIDFKIRLDERSKHQREKQQQKFFAEQLKRRHLIGQPSTIEPWYSLNRNSNIIILGVMLTSLIFLKPITDAISGLRNSYRLHQEEIKFRKQLDEEERIEKLQNE